MEDLTSFLESYLCNTRVLYASAGTLLFIAYYLLSTVYKWFLRPGTNYAKYRGKWAVITGASFGIGEGLANNLAKQGVNIALVARTKEKLDAIAAKITTEHGVKAAVFPFDLSSTDSKAWADLGVKLDALNPVILINNAGISNDCPEPYQESERDFVERIVRLNIMSYDKMTRELLAGFVKRKAGLIVFLSSGFGILPGPMLAQYCGSKAYAIAFAKSLKYELQQHGVGIQVITPGFVQSEMVKSRPSFMLPTSDTFTRAVVQRLGQDFVTAAYWPHQLLIWLGSVLPEWVVAKVTYSILSGTRARKLARDAREAKKQ
eukprot:TRINITY_DN7725_c0_g1_i1.p1 TRINITY_DN7725_c0_g1~~TRINITY_DN7725_c0_g1_i1.p1  ORF type:complete len:318 (+),score=44.79 TRINITY_DN7725_c0_g1_i1:112-1065(+)